MSCFLIDPHVHTSETSRCGKIEASRLAELYQRAGYDGIIITDHYGSIFFEQNGEYACQSWEEKINRFLKGYRNARRAGRAIGLEVFLGIELTFEGLSNDYLIYGLDEEFLLSNRELHLLNLERFRGIAGEGVLIIQAHPFRPGSQPADQRYLDGIEVYNGNPRHDSENERSLSFAEQHGLLQLAASDCHRPEDVGRGGMIFPEKLTSVKDFTAAFHKAKLRVSAGG